MNSVVSSEKPRLDLKMILDPIRPDMVELDLVIQNSLSSDVALINQISTYLIEAGGKRIRPALLFLVARALAGETPLNFTHTIAAVVEFIHTATLLHDDVVDESDLRRGRKTANAAFGNAASVLVGDFLYSRAFQMMVVPSEIKIMEILSSATNMIAEGEVLQLLNLNDPHVDEERYRQVIMYKTAKLFEASSELGAVLAKSNQDQYLAASKYGKHLGVTFQLVDDWLDYAADAKELGKNVGDDLREGKPTLPLIFLLKNGSPHDRLLASKAIEQAEEYDEALFLEVLEAVRRSGALQYTIDQAVSEAGKARACLAYFPDNPYTDALHQLCEYSLIRSS